MTVRKKTGGRRKGTPNKATAHKEREIAKSGLTPLEYMLKIMRNPKASNDRRDDMAKAAAPYVHRRLASMQHTGANGGPIQTATFDAERLAGMDKEELDALERACIQLGITEGSSQGEGEEA